MLAMLGACQSDPHTYALIETEYGNIKVKLYEDTPKHRDNFVKLVEEGYYDSLLFHRVIQGFMIQGGDPDSRYANPGQMLGMGGPGYRIDAEIGSYHYRGALAAARDNNPQKRSSGSQFYIVDGRPVNEQQLQSIEQQKNIQYTPEARERYLQEGGAPFLDGDYTVFGEVVEGMEVVDKIASASTNQANRPLEDVRMKVSIIE